MGASARPQVDSTPASRSDFEGRQIIEHSGLYLAARGLPGVFNFVSLAVFTRCLGLAEFGQLALTVSGAAFANATMFSWVRLGLQRLLPRHADHRGRFLSTAALLLVGVAAVCLLATLGVLLVTAPGGPAGLWVLGCALAIAQGANETALTIASTDVRPGRYARLAAIRSLVLLGAGGAAAIATRRAEAVLLAMIGANLIAAGVGWGGERRRVRIGTWHHASAREIITYGLPLTLNFLLAVLVESSDRFLLAGFRGTAEAGIYSALYDLAQQPIIVLMSIINLATWPLLVQAAERGGVQSVWAQRERHGALIVIAGGGVVATCLGQPELVARAVVGPEFAPRAPALLPLIALGALLWGVKTFFFDLAFQLGRATIIQVIGVAVAAALNIGLNLLWIPRYGAVGAVWSTLIAYGAAASFSWLLGLRVCRGPIPWGPWARVGGAILAAGLVGGLVRPEESVLGAIAAGAAGVVLYALLLTPTVLRIWNAEERI